MASNTLISRILKLYNIDFLGNKLSFFINFPHAN